jgi:hypothetical protein
MVLFMARELTTLTLSIPLKDGTYVSVRAYRTIVPGLYAHKELSGKGWGLSDDQGHYHPEFYARTLKGIRAQMEERLATEALQAVANRIASHWGFGEAKLVEVADDPIEHRPELAGEFVVAIDIPPTEGMLTLAEHWQAVATVLQEFPKSLVREHKEEDG